jgi:hypothetical protein
MASGNSPRDERGPRAMYVAVLVWLAITIALFTALSRIAGP